MSNYFRINKTKKLTSKCIFSEPLSLNVSKHGASRISYRDVLASSGIRENLSAIIKLEILGTNKWWSDVRKRLMFALKINLWKNLKNKNLKKISFLNKKFSNKSVRNTSIT